MPVAVGTEGLEAEVRRERPVRVWTLGLGVKAWRAGAFMDWIRWMLCLVIVIFIVTGLLDVAGVLSPHRYLLVALAEFAIVCTLSVVILWEEWT